MNMGTKVEIVYSLARRGNINARFSAKDVKYCQRHYPIGVDDTSRATKKNIEAYVRARDSGYRKEFNDFCYERGLVDKRKHRDGVDFQNKGSEQWSFTVLLVIILCVAAVYYHEPGWVPIIVIGVPAVQFFAGRQRLLKGVAFIFVAYFLFSFLFGW